MMTEEQYRVKQARRTSIRAFFPILGLLLIIAFGAIAYYTGPILTDVARNLITVPSNQLDSFDWISRAVIFFIMILITALVYAAAAPKPKRLVSERDLDRERKARIKGEIAAKQQQKKVRAQMAQDRKKKSDDPFSRG